MVAEVCLSSISSMLHISYIARPDSSLKIILPFNKSLRMDLLPDPIINFSNFYLVSCIFSSSGKIAS